MGCILLAVFAGLLALAIMIGGVSVFATSPAIGGVAALFFGFNILYGLTVLLLLLFVRGRKSRRWAGALAFGYALYFLAGSMDGGRVSGLEAWTIVIAFSMAWIHYKAVSCLAQRRSPDEKNPGIE